MTIRKFERIKYNILNKLKTLTIPFFRISNIFCVRFKINCYILMPKIKLANLYKICQYFTYRVQTVAFINRTKNFRRKPD